MNSDPVRVSRIDFQKAIPSLRLFEAIPLAFSVPILLPSLIVAVAGVWIPTTSPGDEFHPPHFYDWPGMGYGPELLSSLISHLRLVSARGLAVGGGAFVRLGLLASILAVLGVTVARAAGLKFCSDRRVGLFRSVRYAISSLKSICTGLALISLICGIVVLGFRFLVMVTVVAPKPEDSELMGVLPGWLGGVLLIVLLLICVVAWLLSLAAIGVDSCDGPESLSRGICFVLSRFRMAVMHVAIVMMLCASTPFVVSLISLPASELVRGARLGPFTFRTDRAYSTQYQYLDRHPFSTLHDLVTETIRLSLFFSGITICYVLLRQAEDGVSLTEIDGGKPRV